MPPILKRKVLVIASAEPEEDRIFAPSEIQMLSHVVCGKVKDFFIQIFPVEGNSQPPYIPHWKSPLPKDSELMPVPHPEVFGGSVLTQLSKTVLFGFTAHLSDAASYCLLESLNLSRVLGHGVGAGVSV